MPTSVPRTRKRAVAKLASVAISDTLNPKPEPKSGPNQGRHWVFTWNNYDDDFRTKLVHASDELVRYEVYQEEIGEQGTPHIQGYVEFARPVRLAALKKWLPSAHWEARLGTRDQARAYCMKDDTRRPGTTPTEIGAWETCQGRRNDLTSACETLKQHGLKRVAEDHPEMWVKFHRGFESLDNKLRVVPEVWDGEFDNWWIHGDAGVGKTRYVREKYPGFYDKMANKWWDDYKGEETVVMEDLQCDDARALYGSIVKWADRAPTRVESKGGSMMVNPRRVVVTSNWPMDVIWSGVQLRAMQRRFQSVHLDK